MKKYTYNIILGANIDSEPVAWHWDYENALAIVGKGGSGKTTAALYWLAQLAAMGVKTIMCDPHAEHKESLYAQSDFMHSSFLLPCAKTYSEIMERILFIHELGSKRITNEETDHFPVLLVIDEFTSFLINYPGAKDAVMKLLDSVNQFRKIGIRVFAISQTWSQALKMASGLRDAFSSSVILKSSANEARKFTAFEATAREASLLVPGQGYYQDEKIWIPRITSTGKLAVAQKLLSFGYSKPEPVRAAKTMQLYANEQNVIYYATQTKPNNT